MALKAKLPKDAYEALPEPLREHYKEGDGGTYVLEGLEDAAAVKEFRRAAIAAQKERDQLRERYKDIDPEEYRALKERSGRQSTEVDDLIRAGVEKATSSMGKRLKAIEDERDRLRAENEAATFARAITDMAVKLGVQPDYHEDVVHRARSRGFGVFEGKVAARRDNGPILDDDGKELTLEGFVKAMPAGFFGVTRGSGPGGAPGGTGGTGPTGGILYNPDLLTFGKHAEAIASGKVQVHRPTT